MFNNFAWYTDSPDWRRAMAALVASRQNNPNLDPAEVQWAHDWFLSNPSKEQFANIYANELQKWLTTYDAHAGQVADINAKNIKAMAHGGKITNTPFTLAWSTNTYLWLGGGLIALTTLWYIVKERRHI